MKKFYNYNVCNAHIIYGIAITHVCMHGIPYAGLIFTALYFHEFHESCKNHENLIHEICNLY